jgi:hypothetical protein
MFNIDLGRAPGKFCDGITRRGFLKIGMAGAATATLADVWRAQAASAATGTGRKDTSVILIWLDGGPSHMDMYDLKPQAPAEFRGIWSPIKTNVAGIYAIGDIVKGPALAHVASAEGIICVEKLAGHKPEPLNYNNLPGCTYCSPEIASVGMTEEAAKKAGYEIKVGKFPFTASGKAKAAGAPDGFVKLIFDAKYGEWLGAHFIGANVTEMIAEVVVARKLETTGHEIIKSVHPHPTMSEAIMEAAAAAYGEVIHL